MQHYSQHSRDFQRKYCQNLMLFSWRFNFVVLGLTSVWGFFFFFFPFLYMWAFWCYLWNCMLCKTLGSHIHTVRFVCCELTSSWAAEWGHRHVYCNFLASGLCHSQYWKSCDTYCLQCEVLLGWEVCELSSILIPVRQKLLSSNVFRVLVNIPSWEVLVMYVTHRCHFSCRKGMYDAGRRFFFLSF